MSNTNAVVDFNELQSLVHQLGRDVLRANAKDVDEKGRFPSEGFAAFKTHKLLSSYVPVKFGGMGLDILQLSKLCEIMGNYCASTAMVFAMHQIQIACIVHHCETSEYFQNFLRDLVKNQYVVASATTEVGTGGDLRSSICAIETEGDTFRIEKQAPVVSYAKDADFIFITCRRTAESQPSDQLQVLVDKREMTLEQIASWSDAFGFRGTCSDGFKLKGAGNVAQIQPVPFAEILASSMHPTAHVLWSSLWLGLAQDAVNIARQSVRQALRRNPDLPPISSMRLAEVDEMLYTMRSNVLTTAADYQQKLDANDPNVFGQFTFAIGVNNLKVRSSELVVEIVTKALYVVGIAGYKNDSPISLTRHLRDAYGAALMVNNDRIRGHNATLQIMVRDPK